MIASLAFETSSGDVLALAHALYEQGVSGWMRRYSGLLSLLAVLATCLLVGLLVGHWVTQSKTPGKQVVEIKKGVTGDLAKKIVKMIKDSKIKVQASIQGDAVRISGAKRDDLQQVITMMKKNVTDYPLQFANFRD